MATPEQQRAVSAMWAVIPATVNRATAQRHVPLLLESLREDEIPAHLATARNKAHGALNTALLISGDIGIMIVTNQRLLWLGGVRAQKPRVIEVRADEVSGARGTAGGPMSSKLTVTSTSKSFSFYELQPKEEGQGIAQTLNRRSADGFTVEPLASPGPASTASKAESGSPDTGTGPRTERGLDLLEQVKRLAELHDAGILDDEEFEAKKSQLLDRL